MRILVQRLASLSAVGVLGLFAQTVPATVSLNGNQLTVKNDSSSAMTALAYTISQSDSPHHWARTVFRDAIVTSVEKVIPPGAERTFMEPGHEGPGTPILELKAAVFEDGTTFGDPQWIQVLLQRRVDFLRGLNSGLTDLQNAAGHNMSRDAILRELAASRDATVAAISFVPVAPNSPPPVAGSQEASAQRRLLSIANMDCKERVRIVYFSLIGNITKPPTHSDGRVLTLSETVNWLTQLLRKERDTVLHSLPAVVTQ
ncbi:MAG TPA: hypothetical protein VG675_07335 [Bryobacteraceae bacterium]|nr:hypothetical protein [Bryobacteraceae bacterium]